MQLNLCKKDTLGLTKVAVLERFKNESMYGLSAKRVAVVERSPSAEVRL